MRGRNEMRVWVVILDKEPVINEYRSDYFPRKMHYKADAEKLVAKVMKKGGEAHIERWVK
jgi:hypothetical protein